MGSKIITTEFFDSPTGKIEDSVFLVKHDVYKDNRGAFFESFKEDELKKPFDNMAWCKQINTSTSHPWVFRGMHTQTGKYCQAKMVTCVLGSVYDVIVDFRPDSKTFGNYITVHLTAENKDSLYVPRGFLHGFLSDETPLFSVGMTPMGTHAMQSGQNVFSYMCDNVYNKEYEIGINPLSFFCSVSPNEGDDGFNKILMAINSKKIIFSEKDTNGLDYRRSISIISEDYHKNKKLWYRG